MKLHIFTLNWNGSSKLQLLKESLYKDNYIKNNNFIWHIRDNGSSDDSIKTIESWKDDRVIVYEIEHNRDSFAKGINFLFEKSNPNDEDLILLLNNDVMFGDDKSLSNMIGQMKEGVGVVGARLLYFNTDNLQHSGVIISKRYGMIPYHYRHKEKSDLNAEKNRYFQAVTAACALVKTSSFRRIGGMDENYNWAFEDIDMCLSIGQKEKIVYCGQTKIFHEESASLKKNPVNKIFFNKNVQFFKNKWNGKYSADHDFYLNDVNHNVIK